ncbi:MAG: hypothetical protein ACRECQ_06170 [Burkholderiaceae bacterium]
MQIAELNTPRYVGVFLLRCLQHLYQRKRALTERAAARAEVGSFLFAVAFFARRLVHLLLFLLDGGSQALQRIGHLRRGDYALRRLGPADDFKNAPRIFGEHHNVAGDFGAEGNKSHEQSDQRAGIVKGPLLY